LAEAHPAKSQAPSECGGNAERYQQALRGHQECLDVRATDTVAFCDVLVLLVVSEDVVTEAPELMPALVLVPTVPAECR